MLDLEAKKEAPETPEKHNKVEFHFFVIVLSIGACWTRSLEMDLLLITIIKDKISKVSIWKQKSALHTLIHD